MFVDELLELYVESYLPITERVSICTLSRTAHAIPASAGPFRASTSVPEIIHIELYRKIVNSMAATIPYTYFQCPCTSDISTPLRKGGEPVRSREEGEVEDERNFDPRAPRSNYSLYPLEHLLYCEDCQQIRCPRCVLDEIVTWYCPNCLFEVPSSTVKSEGNRYVL
jgi:Dynactin p62 family